jgi:hypothetical protein
MIIRVLRVVLTVLLLGGLLWFAQNPYFLHLAKTEYTLFTTLLSVTVILVSLRHSLRDLGLLGLATVLFLAVASRPDHFHFGMPLLLSAQGLASIALLGITGFWTRESQAALLWGFGVSVTLVGSGWVLPILLTWVAKANPKSFDLYLLSFDASLRFQPSFLLGQAFARWPLFGKLATAFYMGIICLCTLVFADHLKRSAKRAAAVFAPFLFSGPIGILYYNLFPARGPLYLFSGDNFPHHPLPLDIIRHFPLEPVPVFGFPNAMPSLHMTWALLAFWYSRGGSRWVRAVSWAFLVFTVIATLGTGEHYFVDLVVAAPFSLMIVALFAFHIPWSNPWRIRSIIFGATVPVVWMTLLRFQPGYFWVTPLTPWALIIATLGATHFFEQRLSGMSQSDTAVPESGTLRTEPLVSSGTDA